MVSTVKTVTASCRPGASQALAEKLPEGTYKLASGEPGQGSARLAARAAPVRYLPVEARTSRSAGRACSSPAKPAKIEETVRLAEATALVRDLVNTPAAISGLPSWRRQCESKASAFGAQLHVTSGRDLAEGYPLIAAVGGAASADARTAADRARMGQAGRSARRDRRQGRVLRQRRSRSQAGARACGS